MFVLRRIRDVLSEPLLLNSPPILILNSDALEEIFYQCLLYSSDISSPSRVLPTLTLSHVCQLWHDVAIGSARLWTTICLNLPDLGLHYLKLSGVAPLHISWFGMKNWGKRETTLLRIQLRAHVSRIRLVDLIVMPAQATSFFVALGKDLPFLEVCNIQSMTGPGVHLHEPIPIPFHAPRLRRLTIRFLTLNTSDVTDVLRETRSLEHFRMDGVILSDVFDSHIVHLPHLRTCIFYNVRVADLLNSLRFSSTVYLDIHHTIPTVGEFMWYSQLTPSSITYLRSLFQHTTLALGRRHTHTTPHVLHDTTRGALSLRTRNSGDVDVSIQEVVTFSRKLVDWSSLAVLEINGDGSFGSSRDTSTGGRSRISLPSRSSWDSLFNGLPALTTLIVAADMELDDMTYILRIPIPSSESSSQETAGLYCPLLRSLKLVGFDLDCDYVHDENSGDDENPAVGPWDRRTTSLFDVRCICWLLESRRKEGMPLDEVRLEGCRLHKTTELLKGVSDGLKVVIE